MSDLEIPIETTERVVSIKPIETAPPWVAPMIRHTIWRIVWVSLGMTVVVLCLLKARSLMGILVIAMFFGIAMDPAVTSLNVKRGWKRGAATGLVFAGVLSSVVLLIGVLIPAMVTVTARISDRVPTWIASINKTFNLSIATGTGSSDAASALKDSVTTWIQSHASQILGLASSGVGLVFQFFTIAMFTFYFAADAPRIRRAVLQRIPPARQERIGWAWDTAIQQTGGYFYSRLLLMIVNGLLFFGVMLMVGMPWLIALALSAFEAFVAEFIPAIGTYLGAAVPVVATLGLQGLWPAAILIVWTVIYQQLENYWLSPKVSAKTMEINGGVAFAAALAGGAIAGPMGAFLALPVAAMATSFVTHYVSRYPLVYRSAYDADLPESVAIEDSKTRDTDAQTPALLPTAPIDAR